MTEYILLGFLMDREMTGYDMKQFMSMSTSYFADASFGSIYPSLKKLEQRELIGSREAVENGKLKKMYSINKKGEAEFRKWLSAPIDASRCSFSGALAKIFFYRFLPEDQAAGLIGGYVKDIGDYRDSLALLKKKVEKRADRFELCTLNFGLDFYDFIIRWYEDYWKKIGPKSE